MMEIFLIFSNLYMVSGQQPRSVAQEQVYLFQLLYFCRSFLEPDPGATRRKEEFLLQPCKSRTVCSSRSLRNIE